jgi:hypothetical protein
VLDRRGDPAAIGQFQEAVRLKAENPAFEFEAARLMARPASAADLARVFHTVIDAHPSWTGAKRQAVRSAARYGRPPGITTSRDERAAFRRLALAWFNEYLELSAADAVATPSTIPDHATATANWLADTELAYVRSPLSLLLLPADERQDWSRLWAAVRRARSDWLAGP